jgi:hypothetical protein
VRLRDIGDTQQRLLRQLAGRISTRLDAEFTECAAGETPTIGVALRERGQSALMEIPEALLLRADAEPVAREELRVRIKATRDRMLFRPPPPPLPKNIAAAADPAFFRGGFGRGPGPGRGRR